VSVDQEGVSMDLGFIQKELETIAHDVFRFSASHVTTTHIYTHMRYYRARWVEVLKLKRLQAVRWEEEMASLIIDNDIYFEHIKIDG
jgi:hypothetical protein